MSASSSRGRSSCGRDRPLSRSPASTSTCSLLPTTALARSPPWARWPAPACPSCSLSTIPTGPLRWPRRRHPGRWRSCTARHSFRPATMAEPEVYFPPVDGDAWEQVGAGSLGWDEGGLHELLDLLGARDTLGVVILHRGRLVAERYWQGAAVHSTGDLGSGQKSIVSFLVGVAQAQGRVTLGDRVANHL